MLTEVCLLFFSFFVCLFFKVREIRAKAKKRSKKEEKKIEE